MNNEPFWPSLYSRLVPEKYQNTDPYSLDKGPETSEDWAPAHFLIDLQTLKRHIEIDLLNLLNSTSIEAAILAKELDGQDIMADKKDYPFAGYPLVRNSIVNYGLPSVVGRQIYNLPLGALEEDIKEAILAFEPRLDPLSLRVELTRNDDDQLDPAEPIGFKVSAEIRTSGAPMKLYINSIWDLEKVRSEVQVAR